MKDLVVWGRMFKPFLYILAIYGVLAANFYLVMNKHISYFIFICLKT